MSFVLQTEMSLLNQRQATVALGVASQLGESCLYSAQNVTTPNLMEKMIGNSNISKTPPMKYGSSLESELKIENQAKYRLHVRDCRVSNHKTTRDYLGELHEKNWR